MNKTIWQEDEEDDLKPVTDMAVAKAEKKLKVTLPESYISILKEQDGGYLIYDSFPTDFPTSWADDHINVDYIMGIGGEESILDSSYLIKEWGLPKKLVLISGDGHTWIALDYRKTSVNPPVIYIDVEFEQVVEIAENFQTFLSKLYIEEEMEGEELEIKDLEEHEYTPGDLDIYMKENSTQKIIDTLASMVEDDIDTDRLSEKLLQLSTYQNSDVRIEVANLVWNSLTYQLDEETLNKLIKTFEKDTDSDVKMHAQLILEKINYSFEDLKRDLKISKHVVISYQNNFYHLHLDGRKWRFSDSERDLQTFNSLDKLLNQTTLDGMPLREKWNEIKVV